MSKIFFVRTWGIALLACLLLSAELTFEHAIAADSNAFTIAQAASCCDSIVIARFVRELKGEKSLDKTGLKVGGFHTFYCLKGAPYGRDLPILIHPGKVTGCSVASKELMPKNSIWIIFIDSPLRKLGAIEPYGGGAGIMPYSESALSETVNQVSGGKPNPNALQTAKDSVEVEVTESQLLQPHHTGPVIF